MRKQLNMDISLKDAQFGFAYRTSGKKMLSNIYRIALAINFEGFKSMQKICFVGAVFCCCTRKKKKRSCTHWKNRQAC